MEELLCGLLLSDLLLCKDASNKEGKVKVIRVAVGWPTDMLWTREHRTSQSHLSGRDR